MIQVKLLKDHDGHKAGDSISVSNNVAFGLYEKGIGLKPRVKDSFVKSDIGETKAFEKAPSKSTFTTYKRSPKKSGKLDTEE